MRGAAPPCLRVHAVVWSGGSSDGILAPCAGAFTALVDKTGKKTGMHLRKLVRIALHDCGSPADGKERVECQRELPAVLRRGLTPCPSPARRNAQAASRSAAALALGAGASAVSLAEAPEEEEEEEEAFVDAADDAAPANAAEAAAANGAKEQQE